MKQLVSYILMGLSLLISYEAYENAQLRPETELLARGIACDHSGACLLLERTPREERSGPIRRRYEFRTTSGPVLVTCTRDLYFLGPWDCESAMGSFGTF